MEAIEGIINLDKPAGLTSARVVDRVKRLLPRKTRIGHAGTLDPFATGVLLLLIGRATRSCESLMNAPKEYHATIKLGAVTASDDPEFPEEPFPGGGRDGSSLTIDAIQSTVAGFVGEVSQRPPAFSAMKIGGERAYKLARRGEMPVMQPRIVRIDQIEIISYDWPLLRVGVACGRGTYIRALARDIGAALEVGGYLTELRRTRVGSFTADDAVTLESLQRERIGDHLKPVPTEAS